MTSRLVDTTPVSQDVSQEAFSELPGKSSRVKHLDNRAGWTETKFREVGKGKNEPGLPAARARHRRWWHARTESRAPQVLLSVLSLDGQEQADRRAESALFYRQ
jgi:hypothetical protein